MPRGRSAPRLPQGITQGLPRGSHRTPPRRAGCCPGCGPVRRGGMLSPTDTQPHRPRQPQPRRCRDALGGGHRQQVRPPGGRTGGGAWGGSGPGGRELPAALPPRPGPGRGGKGRAPRHSPARLGSRVHAVVLTAGMLLHGGGGGGGGGAPRPPSRRGSGGCRDLLLPPPLRRVREAAAAAVRPAPARLPGARSRSLGPASPSPPVAGADTPPPPLSPLPPRGRPGRRGGGAPASPGSLKIPRSRGESLPPALADGPPCVRWHLNAAPSLYRFCFSSWKKDREVRRPVSSES